jgi:chromosome segregation ATPase
MDDKINIAQSLRNTADAQLADKTQEIAETRSGLEASNVKVAELTATVENLKASMGRNSSALARATDLGSAVNQMEEELKRVTNDDDDNWVMQQRYQHGLLIKGEKSLMTPFRIQELNSLGFEWVFVLVNPRSTTRNS